MTDRMTDSMTDRVAPLRAGLCSVTFRRLAPEDVIDIAVSASLDGIEWGGDVHVPPGEVALATRLAARCDEGGLACPSYGSYLAAGKSSPEQLAPVLDSALALGACNVRVWCPLGSPPNSDGALFARAADDLASWAASAGRLGLTLSLEFHAATFTETAESVARLLGAAGRPDNLFSYWQPVGGRDRLSEATAVLPDLSHVHVFQWADDGARRPLADGADTWPQVLELATTRCRWQDERYAFLEFVAGDETAALTADASTLRGWL
jgi:sugar phosphate isomerase/epimerase